MPVSNQMSLMGATHQTILDLAPTPEDGLKTLTGMFEPGTPPHTAAKVFAAWHSAHRGYKLNVKVSAQEVMTHLAENDSTPLLYVYPFYADHLPDLFSPKIDWQMVTKAIHRKGPHIKAEPMDDSILYGVDVVMFSTNFKNHANHTWLQHLTYGHENKILFLSPVVIQPDETATYYRLHRYLEATPGQCITLLQSCEQRGIKVVDLDCQTNDLTPSVLNAAGVKDSIPLIGYQAPPDLFNPLSSTTVYEPSMVQTWSILKGIIPPANKPPKRMLINAAPIKWMSADMDGVRATLEAYDGPIMFRKAKETYWYAKELEQALGWRVVFDDRDYSKAEYANLLQSVTDYLEVSGRGTFSCLMDAKAAGLNVIVAPGRRAFENEVLLASMGLTPEGFYPKPVTRTEFWYKQ